MQLLFFVFLLGYPILQTFTLLRSKGGWRVASILCLIPSLPFYLWTLWKVFTPQSSGDLSGILIVMVAPWPLIYLALLAVLQSAANKR